MNQNNSVDYTKIVSLIIKNQEYIVGPVAWSEAGKINGLKIESTNVQVIGDGKQALELLVNQYATLFGKASIEVCKEAVRDMLASVDKRFIPANLL